MGRLKIGGWILSVFGTLLWVYGYWSQAAPPLVNWAQITPHWFAEFLPDLYCELGFLLSCVSLIPLYWPEPASRKKQAARPE